MKYKYIITLSAILMLGISSCEKDFLDQKPLDQFSEKDVWTDALLAETYINGMYRTVLGFPQSITRLSDFTDESFFMHWGNVTSFNQSLISPDDLQGWWGTWEMPPQTRHLSWERLYQDIRKANVFFANKGTLESEDPELIDRLSGEAYFLRAYAYHHLVSLYGGVAIITKQYALNDDFNFPRDSYEDCINFIVEQLDSAAALLPDVYADANSLGRATSGAALTLKSRVLLYAASDLHNPDRNSVVSSGYQYPELVGYTGGNANTRWTLARDAAKAVIDLGLYSLYKATPAPTDSVALNIIELFLADQTNEDILLQHFTSQTDEGWQGYNPGLYTGPNGYHAWGCNTPIGELVDDYEMKDGSAFDWNNAVHAAAPYSNRDARLHATVLYEGAGWAPRPSDAALFDPFDIIQVGTVYNIANDEILKPGIDTRNGPLEDWNGTKTGYYLRKFMDPTVPAQYQRQDIPFRNMRYAEVLLNYAEACNELGEDAEALTYINMIRTRAGQPVISGITGDDLRQAIRHERRIEMAYEDQRFWDIRRWLIGDEITTQTTAIEINYMVETTSDENDYTRFFIPPDGYTGTRADGYRKTDGSTWGNPEYTPIETPGDSRVWDNKMYFFPIMREEMDRNENLVQNPGY